jgi:hypothetical protein
MNTLNEVGELLSVEQSDALLAMLQRLGMAFTEAVDRMSSGRVRKVTFTFGDKAVIAFFNLTQTEPRPENRRHFFEALEFRVGGKLDGAPAYLVWNDVGGLWSSAHWSNGVLIEKTMVPQ